MKRILVVDDEPYNIRILKMALVKEGYEVEQAFDGAEALEKVDEWNPDVVITDVQMPRMTGIELCHNIRNVQQDIRTFIVIVTSRTESDLRDQAADMGGIAFLEKPVSLRGLKTLLSDYFSSQVQVGSESV